VGALGVRLLAGDLPEHRVELVRQAGMQAEAVLDHLDPEMQVLEQVEGMVAQDRLSLLLRRWDELDEAA